MVLPFSPQVAINCNDPFKVYERLVDLVMCLTRFFLKKANCSGFCTSAWFHGNVPRRDMVAAVFVFLLDIFCVYRCHSRPFLWMEIAELRIEGLKHIMGKYVCCSLFVTLSSSSICNECGMCLLHFQL
jgi:hypothetical protein